MCLATPLKVIKVNKNTAFTNTLGKQIEINTSLLKNIKKGDFLYATRGIAIKKIPRREAEKVLELIKKWP